MCSVKRELFERGGPLGPWRGLGQFVRKHRPAPSTGARSIRGPLAQRRRSWRDSRVESRGHWRTPQRRPPSGSPHLQGPKRALPERDRRGSIWLISHTILEGLNLVLKIADVVAYLVTDLLAQQRQQRGPWNRVSQHLHGALDLESFHTSPHHSTQAPPNRLHPHGKKTVVMHPADQEQPTRVGRFVLDPRRIQSSPGAREHFDRREPTSSTSLVRQAPQSTPHLLTDATDVTTSGEPSRLPRLRLRRSCVARPAPIPETISMWSLFRMCLSVNGIRPRLTGRSGDR